VFGVGEFRVIFTANLVSMLGNVVAAVALTVLVYDQTRSPALAALVLALSFLPYLIGGALLGAAADRLPARRALVACDLASAVLVACMMIPGIPVPGLLALLFVNGLISPVYQGIRSAVLPEVLPPGPAYVLGRALMRMVAQSAQIVGYGVGGLLLAVLSPRGALAADALSFAASGVLLRFGIAARPGHPAGSRSMAGDSLDGLRQALTHRKVRRILLFSWLVPACAVAPEALAAPYATHIGEAARAAGFLLMGIPAGTVAADVIAARLLPVPMQRRRRPRRATGLCTAASLRGQPGPPLGPGTAGDLGAGLRLGRWDRRAAHRYHTTGPKEPCPGPRRLGPDARPGPGVRAVGDRGTVRPAGRCDPHGRCCRCRRRRHAPAGSAAPHAHRRAPFRNCSDK